MITGVFLAAASGRRPRTVQDDDRRSRQGVQRDHGSYPGGAQNLPAVRHLHWPREPVLVHYWTGSDDQVARGEAVGAGPRHGSAQRTHATAEQRASAPRVRSEGERCRPVDRASSGRRRHGQHAERQAGGELVTPVRPRQGGGRVQTEHR